MNDVNPQHGPAPAARPEDADVIAREVLISRIVDHEDSDAAWQQLSRLAAADPTVWRDLALSQRHQTELARAVTVALRGADQIDLPPALPARRRQGPTYSLSRWSGWAVAAVLGLAWAGAMFGNLPGSGDAAPGPVTAGWQPANSQEALSKYLEVGQRDGCVVGEVPQVLMIQSRPTPNGNVEVFFLRQFMERRIVPDVYQVGQDEGGRPVAVPISQTRSGGKL
ncbi:MAG: hypothetical protein AB7G11_00205 [Phycisphaerales bacterium]